MMQVVPYLERQVFYKETIDLLRYLWISLMSNLNPR
jgi:hypothetical protein